VLKVPPTVTPVTKPGVESETLLELRDANRESVLIVPV
jgi:hypothetical protein